MQCNGGAPYCNTTTKRCVQCLTNANCMGRGTSTLCDPATDTCVQCLTNANCTNPMRPTCSLTGHVCVP
jgi:hypothetical protein